MKRSKTIKRKPAAIPLRAKKTGAKSKLARATPGAAAGLRRRSDYGDGAPSAAADAPQHAKLDMPALESWLWDAACIIRGAMDAPKFKDYILPLIFVKRLSDVYEDELHGLAKKLGDVETAAQIAADDHGLVRFYIPSDSTWPELRKLTRDVGQRLTDAVRGIADETESLQGVINIVDFNATVSGERIIADEKLSALIEVISRHRVGLADAEPDLLGRAYEYLLRKFAEGQGQSAGEFYTPREVGMILARILNPAPGQMAYDPACGSAGLLVNANRLPRESRHGGGRATAPLVRTRAKPGHVRDGQDEHGHSRYARRHSHRRYAPQSEVSQWFGVKRFDLVVANPMWNQDGYDPKFYDEDPFGRFRFGYPTANSADWGWVQHMVASLADDGRAGVVLDTGAVSRGSGSKSSN